MDDNSQGMDNSTQRKKKGELSSLTKKLPFFGNPELMDILFVNIFECCCYRYLKTHKNIKELQIIFINGSVLFAIIYISLSFNNNLIPGGRRIPYRKPPF